MSRMLRASAIMAAGTMVSRITGFVRTMVLATAIGTAAMGDAYNAAYAIPYSILDLLLLGVLSSVVVPMIVRAHSGSSGASTGGAAVRCFCSTAIGVGPVKGSSPTSIW